MTNRKDKIKNITIIFLLIMLVLTFFSNTIMNYSLVEVSTQQVTSGSITTKVRGSGSVEASESYSVTIEQTRKIATVNVKKNAEVSAGDLLFTLEDSDSDELDAAKKSMNDAQAAYETAVLASGITVAERQSIENGKGSSLTDKQNQIASANQRVTDAQAAVDAAQANVDKIKAQIDALGNSVQDTTAEEKAVLDAEKRNSDAQDNLANVEANYTSKKTEYETALSKMSDAQTAWETAKRNYDIADKKLEKKKADYDATSNLADTDPKRIEAKTAKENAEEVFEEAKYTFDKADEHLKKSQDEFDSCNSKLKDIQPTYENAQSASTNTKVALNNANYKLSVKKLTGNNTEAANNLQAQLNTASAALTDATTALNNATNDAKKVTDKINGEVSIRAAYETLKEAREEVAKQEKKSIGTEITSPIAGTVTDIAVSAGTTVNANDVMMTIQPENKAYILQFSVTENQAKKIKVGDQAEVVNNWYGNDISAVVSSIRRDPQNRANNIVICELKGEVGVGDNYTLSIGQQSSNYDNIVPTSAIREDSNGKFILIIESKSTPLGNRYYARRVDVDVITSDDTKSAVTGALEGYEYVITTTTKPIKENEQVRLASE